MKGSKNKEVHNFWMKLNTEIDLRIERLRNEFDKLPFLVVEDKRLI